MSSLLCAALAACSESATNRTVTAPDAEPAFRKRRPISAAQSPLTDRSTLVFAIAEAASTQQAAAAPQAATGGRASGHVEFTLGTGFLTNIASEQYSFVALGAANATTPFAAKGKYEMTLTTATGVVQEFQRRRDLHERRRQHGVDRRTAHEVVVNGIPRPINPAASHNIWSVTDNGEGKGTTDTASPMIFFPAAVAPLHCATDFIPPQFANEKGNIQVKP